MDGTVMDTLVDYVKLARIVEDEFVFQGIPEEVIEQDRAIDAMTNGLAWLEKNKPEALVGLEKRINDRATAVECEHADLAKPFPGAVDLLKELKSKGYKVAILTRGGRDYAKLILGASGILDIFDGLVARDDYPRAEAKPSAKAMEHMCQQIGVECSEVLYVGDGTVDWRTAVNAGSQFIGVTSGHTDEASWRAAAGDDIVLLPSVADIRKMI